MLYWKTNKRASQTSANSQVHKPEQQFKIQEFEEYQLALQPPSNNSVINF